MEFHFVSLTSGLYKLQVVLLRAVPNQDENPLISRNKGFTSGFWGLISEDKEGLGPHPSLSSEIRGCTQVYLCVPRCTFIVPLQKYQAFVPQSFVENIVTHNYAPLRPTC